MAQDLDEILRQLVNRTLEDYLADLAAFEQTGRLQNSNSRPKEDKTPGNNAAGIASLTSLVAKKTPFRLKREADAAAEPLGDAAKVTPFPGAGAAKNSRDK